MKHKLFALLTICIAPMLCACGSEKLTTVNLSDDPAYIETNYTNNASVESDAVVEPESVENISDLNSATDNKVELARSAVAQPDSTISSSNDVEEAPSDLILVFNNGFELNMPIKQNVAPMYQIGHESDHKCVQYDFTPHTICYYDSNILIDDEDALSQFYKTTCAEAQSLGMECGEFTSYTYQDKNILMNINHSDNLGMYVVLQDIGQPTYLAITIYDSEFKEEQSDLATQNVAFSYLYQ